MSIANTKLRLLFKDPENLTNPYAERIDIGTRKNNDLESDNPAQVRDADKGDIKRRVNNNNFQRSLFLNKKYNPIKRKMYSRGVIIPIS